LDQLNHLKREPRSACLRTLCLKPNGKRGVIGSIPVVVAAKIIFVPNGILHRHDLGEGRPETRA
jgi:hypothetical protein